MPHVFGKATGSRIPSSTAPVNSSVLKVVQIVASPLGMRRGAEDGPFVVVQNLQPACDVAGVILADFRGDADIGAKIGAADFGNQFFHGVAFVPPSFAPEVAIEP